MPKFHVTVIKTIDLILQADDDERAEEVAYNLMEDDNRNTEYDTSWEIASVEACEEGEVAPNV